MSPNENDPLLTLPRKTEKTARRNKTKRERRKCLLVTVGMFGLGLVVGGMVVVKNAKSDASLWSILGDARKAKSTVYTDPETGDYLVDRDPGAIDNRTTFAELAEAMVQPWYEASMMAIFNDPAWTTEGGIDPFTVKPIRKCILETRSIFDVFSPVFPEAENYKEGGKDKSIWRKIRKQYKKGYGLMGDLQDLFDVTYTDEMLEDRVDKVMKWRKKFLKFQKTYRIRRYLYSDYLTDHGGIDPNGRHSHQTSHLFWSDTAKDDLPHGSDPGIESVRALGRLQIEHCLGYLKICREYKTIQPEENEIVFHNMRKILRVFVNTHKLLGTLLVPDDEAPSQAFGDGDAAGTTLESIFALFDEVVVDLGKVNDAWMAHNLYVHEKSHPKRQEKLAEKMDRKWLEFLDWQEGKDFQGKLEYVLKQMTDP